MKSSALIGINGYLSHKLAYIAWWDNYQNISRLERGEISLTLFWCYKLAEAFDMDLADLIKDFGFKL